MTEHRLPKPGAACPCTRCPPAGGGALAVVVAGVVVGGLLVGITFLQGQGTNLPWGLRLTLAHEMTVGAWYSAVLLLACGVLALSAGVLARWRARPGAWALGVLGIVGVGLSLDELGSLHERISTAESIPRMLGLPLIGGVGLGVLVGVIYTLWKHRADYGRAWLGVTVAFGLLGSVYAQELLEHAFDWPEAWFAWRLAIEEGTELAGMGVLLITCARARGKVGADQNGILRADACAVRVLAWVLGVAALGLIVFEWAMPDAMRTPRFGSPGLAPPILLLGLASVACGLRARRAQCGRVVWVVLAVALGLASLESAAMLKSLVVRVPVDPRRIDVTLAGVLPVVVVAGVWLRSRAWVVLAVLTAGAVAGTWWVYKAPVAQAVAAGFSLASVVLATGVPGADRGGARHRAASGGPKRSLA